jgi:hypothetical protein
MIMKVEFKHKICGEIPVWSRTQKAYYCERCYDWIWDQKELERIVETKKEAKK